MGKRFRFIHCADLHLGTPVADVGEGQAHWAKVLREAASKSFANIVDLALEKQVAAILIAGDVYNAADHSLAAQLDFAQELFRAAKAGIRVFVAHGNHDPLGAWRAEVPLPPTVHVFRADRTESIPLVVDGETAALVYGRSYGANAEPEHLAAEFRREEGAPCAIGVLHTQGPESGEGPYAPCTYEELRAAGMDYWALGHVHTRTVLQENPYMIYPGNPQSLHRKETGPRGCYLVEVGSYGTTIPEFCETDAVRREEWTFDVTEVADTDALLAIVGAKRQERRAAVGKPILAALTFTGSGPLHAVLRDAEAREALAERLNEQELFKHLFVYCCRLTDRTRPTTDWTARRELPDATGDYLRAYDELAGLPAAERQSLLREALAERPEFQRYLRLFGEMTDDRLDEALAAAELLGARYLTEAEEYEAD